MTSRRIRTAVIAASWNIIQNVPSNISRKLRTKYCVEDSQTNGEKEEEAPGEVQPVRVRHTIAGNACLCRKHDEGHL